MEGISVLHSPQVSLSWQLIGVGGVGSLRDCRHLGDGCGIRFGDGRIRGL